MFYVYSFKMFVCLAIMHTCTSISINFFLNYSLILFFVFVIDFLINSLLHVCRLVNVWIFQLKRIDNWREILEKRLKSLKTFFFNNAKQKIKKTENRNKNNGKLHNTGSLLYESELQITFKSIEIFWFFK